MMRSILFSLLVSASATVAQTTFSGRLVLTPNWTHSKTVGASSITESYGRMYDLTHTTGTNANQMQAVVTSAHTLTNSQSVVINLQSAVNAFGDSVSFSAVKFLAVVADGSNADAVLVGDAETDPFVSWSGGTNGVLSVAPGGMAMLVAPASGYAVSTNACNLRLLNTGTNSAECVVYIGGIE
jgi:hypothetical protein